MWNAGSPSLGSRNFFTRGSARIAALNAACFAAGMSLRYETHMAHLAPAPVVWGALALLWLGFFLPVLVVLSGPLRTRRRGSEA